MCHPQLPKNIKILNSKSGLVVIKWLNGEPIPVGCAAGHQGKCGLL